MTSSVPARPRLAGGLAAIEVDGHLLLGNERTGRMISIDPVAAVVVGSLDGTATVGELGEDLASATGMEPGSAETTVEILLGALATDGFLDGVEASRGLPRGCGAHIPPGSCLAIRMGLDRADVVRTDTHPPFRFGSTDTELVDQVRSIVTRHGVQTVPDPDGDAPIVFLRASAGRVPRLQQLYGPLGRRWYTGRDHALAASAFRRTVLARCHESDDVWLEGVSLRNSVGIVLVQPGLEDTVLGDLRPVLEAKGVFQVPSARLRLDPDGSLVVPADPVTGIEDERVPIAGALLPDRCPPAEQFRQLSHLLVRWQHPALERLRDAVQAIPIGTASGHEGPSGMAVAVAELRGP